MEKRIELVAIVFTLITSLLFGIVSIKFFGEYGWFLFILTPLIIGFLPPYITSKKKEITKSKSYKLSFITLGLALFGLLIFALEGMICIAMASPILILFTFLGSYLGYASQGNKVINSTNAIIGLVISGIGLMSFDIKNAPKSLIPVTTSVIVNSSIENVWKNVVTFNQIENPTELIFRTGIAYPTNATIEGTGEGAIRHCNFTTGSFVEPITKWDEPNLLQFNVLEQPVPMKEYNPFWEIHPPHLDGYFKSFKGQFKLIELGDKKIKLEGTTWYQVDITPEFYWKLWSNFIIHKIHKRVLSHIKTESEKY